jgi:hypothetical protein
MTACFKSSLYFLLRASGTVHNNSWFEHNMIHYKWYIINECGWHTKWHVFNGFGSVCICTWCNNDETHLRLYMYKCIWHDILTQNLNTSHAKWLKMSGKPEMSTCSKLYSSGTTRHDTWKLDVLPLIDSENIELFKSTQDAHCISTSAIDFWITSRIHINSLILK